MNTRELEKAEAANLRYLAEAGIDCGLVFLTPTGLGKGYFDATIPVRELLRKEGVHDYSSQGLGQPENGVKLDGTIFVDGKAVLIPVSLYRPKTKKGDPRMWPSRLKRFAVPNDVLAVFCHNKEIFFLNLTKESVAGVEEQDSDLSVFLSGKSQNYNFVAQELLYKLQGLAKSGPLLSDGYGDTSIGRTIETALGISMNSSRLPDFKGIEIKAKRSRSKTRQSLFNKVPNWEISRVKNSGEILDEFGYLVDGIRKLNCSVYVNKINSQGLVLDLREEMGFLHEMFQKNKSRSPVCVWKIPTLHESLLLKHKETFWITANEIQRGSKTFFELINVRHTRKPSTLQFNRLLSSGGISVDHMIKRVGTKVKERGPQFKVNAGVLDELFLGTPREYSLLGASF